MTRLAFPGCLAVLLAAVGVTAGSQSPQPAASAQFRGGVLVVPVDVRVVDRQGNPVTDLKESDFSLLENGQAQQLKHFSVVDLSVPAPARPLAPQALLESPTRRVFLCRCRRA